MISYHSLQFKDSSSLEHEILEILLTVSSSGI